MKTQVRILISLMLMICSQQLYSQDSVSTKKDTSLSIQKDPDNIDVKLFRTINNNRSKFLDGLLPITDNSVFPASIALPTVLTLYGVLGKKQYEENTGILLVLSEVLSFGTTFTIKNIVKRKRPYDALDNVHKKTTLFTDPYSFPSGHSNSVFTLTTMIMLRYVKYPYIYIPMYAWSLIVDYGRSYFGMHYPSDLLGGALIGTLSSALIYSLRSDIIKFKNRVFREGDKPDKDVNSKYLGLIGGVFIISNLFNEFILLENNKHQLSISSELNNSNLISLSYKYKF